MSHLSLYRKYRPQSFAEVVGQEAVVESLSAALKSGKISHAYLFSGSRGTGKTSIARIFARELGTSPNDLYEIDAASNNGVDEIRELRDGVNTLPFDSKYKVYILDEVHMLSKAAFNALLKTLEEPPKHVIFILATTEPHKVLDTIKSRCQVFEFNRPNISTLANFVIEIGKQEGVSIEKTAAELIAKMGDGAFRDTLGVLERVMNVSQGKEITLDLLFSLAQLPTSTIVNSFIEGLANEGVGDDKKRLEMSLEFLNKNFNNKMADFYDSFLVFLIEKVRIIILYRFAPELAKELSESLDPIAREKLEDWKKMKLINSALLLEFIHVREETKKSYIPLIPMELALVRLLGNNQ